MADQDKPEECCCCNFVTEELKRYVCHASHLKGIETETFWYCELCASSFTSNAARYPEQYADPEGMKATCYVGNVILKQIKHEGDFIIKAIDGGTA